MSTQKLFILGSMSPLPFMISKLFLLLLSLYLSIYLLYPVLPGWWHSSSPIQISESPHILTHNEVCHRFNYRICYAQITYTSKQTKSLINYFFNFPSFQLRYPKGKGILDLIVNMIEQQSLCLHWLCGSVELFFITIKSNMFVSLK